MSSKLYNKKCKQTLLKELQQEHFARKTISFYKYTELNDLQTLRDALYQEWTTLNVRGRVYIAQEGINAQLSVPEDFMDAFLDNLSTREPFQQLKIKYAVNEGLSFLKLTIKVKKEIVAYNISKDEYDMTNTGQHLNYKAFNEAIEQGAVVLDMRNRYEAEIGRFENAIVPNVDRSKELLPEAKALLKGHEKDKILIYCTGGIRCEKASAYLKHHGFNDVNQLEGGIIQYAHEVKKNSSESKFRGKNFVFDNRMGETITSEILSQCHQCGAPANTHVNCANEACHILFIQCEKCNDHYNHCCSQHCAEFLKKPKAERKHLFKNKEVTFTAQLSDKIKPRLDEVYCNDM